MQATTSDLVAHGTSEPAASSSGANLDSGASASSRVLTAEDAQLGDEFISLTFHESESEEDEDEDDAEASEGEEQGDEEEDESSLLSVVHD